MDEAHKDRRAALMYRQGRALIESGALKLTEQEQRVYDMNQQGKSQKEIGEALGIHQSQVSQILRRLMALGYEPLFFVSRYGQRIDHKAWQEFNKQYKQQTREAKFLSD